MQIYITLIGLYQWPSDVASMPLIVSPRSISGDTLVLLAFRHRRRRVIVIHRDFDVCALDFAIVHKSLQFFNRIIQYFLHIDSRALYVVFVIGPVCFIDSQCVTLTVKITFEYQLILSANLYHMDWVISVA